MTYRAWRVRHTKTRTILHGSPRIMVQAAVEMGMSLEVILWDGTNWTFNNFFDISRFVTATFQTTIQQNIPNLRAAFPQYTIVTWGWSVSFGN